MSRTVKIFIGVNGAFLTRRWENPESFMRLTRDCGFRYHSFCADVLDPFFSGDRAYQLRTARRIGRAAKKYGVRIVDYYTGMATHRFHGLSHADRSCRERMKKWMVAAMEIAVAMGSPRLGGHVDALSVEVLASASRTRRAKKNVYRQFRDLAVIARRKGLKALYDEQMYIPSEIPWTLAETEEFLIETNRGNRRGVPVRMTLDIGHQAGKWYGLKGKDLDYLEWTRRFAAFSDVIHIQQTTRDASHHWPFTPEYNRRGHVRIDRFLKAVKESYRMCAKSPIARYLEPVNEIYLIAEIIPGSTKTEKVLLRELTESSRYLRRFIPENGLKLAVD